MYQEQERWSKNEALRFVTPDYVPKGKVVAHWLHKAESEKRATQPALGKTGKAHRRAMKVQRRMEQVERKLLEMELEDHYKSADWGGF